MDERHSHRAAPEAIESQAPRRKKKRPGLLQLLLRDLLLTGAIMVAFAFFHHVLPRMTAEKREMPAPVSLQTPAVSTAAPGQTAAPTEQPGTDEPEPTPVITPEPTPAPIDWRTKFAEHFTDEVVVTDHSYTSPNISIDIQKLVTDDPAPSTCYIADIYVAQLENFQTYWAMGRLVYYGEESAESLAKSSGAILTINGDYADNQLSGFLVRNGELYYEDQTFNDVCVLYSDGSMETYGPDDYRVDEVLERKPWQVWKFGPALLDEEGQPRKSYNTTGPIQDVNPRSGIGYYEPGHYCFVIVDGRQPGYSAGMRIERFARLFADLGCKAAYNLDGGQSAIMTFQQRIFSRPYLGGRNSGDVLLIREIDEGEEA